MSRPPTRSTEGLRRPASGRPDQLRTPQYSRSSIFLNHLLISRTPGIVPRSFSSQDLRGLRCHSPCLAFSSSLPGPARCTESRRRQPPTHRRLQLFAYRTGYARRSEVFKARHPLATGPELDRFRWSVTKTQCETGWCDGCGPGPNEGVNNQTAAEPLPIFEA